MSDEAILPLPTDALTALRTALGRPSRIIVGYYHIGDNTSFHDVDAAIQHFTTSHSSGFQAARSVINVENAINQLQVNDTSLIAGVFGDIRKDIPDEFQAAFDFLTVNPPVVSRDDVHISPTGFDFENLFKTVGKESRLFMASYIYYLLNYTHGPDFMKIHNTIGKDPDKQSETETAYNALSLSRPSASLLHERFKNVGGLKRLVINLDNELVTLSQAKLIDETFTVALRSWSAVPVVHGLPQ